MIMEPLAAQHHMLVCCGSSGTGREPALAADAAVIRKTSALRTRFFISFFSRRRTSCPTGRTGPGQDLPGPFLRISGRLEPQAFREVERGGLEDTARPVYGPQPCLSPAP